jgi:hypothetical protein
MNKIMRLDRLDLKNIMINTLTNEEFKAKVNEWQSIIAKAGLTLPDGKAIPDKFFHVFLGIGYSTFKKMMFNRDIQFNTVRVIHFLSLLSDKALIKEFEKTIPLYLDTYDKSKQKT